MIAHTPFVPGSVYIEGEVEGACVVTPGNHPGITDDDDFSFDFSSSGSATGNTFAEVFTNLFESLIQPLLINLDPKLNPGEMKPVTSVIKALLKITVTFPDKDGDALITLPIEFSQDTSTSKILVPLYSSGTTVVGRTGAQALTPTSASFAATLGLLLQQLNQLIPELVAQVEGVQGVGSYLQPPDTT